MNAVTNSSPLVSVVIPTFNRAYCLRCTIQSVLGQTYKNWELIIVDNHSTDNTDEVVAEFGDTRIQLLKINNDGVIAASRNKGLHAANGKYVAFLDSDDWWLPEKLEASVRRLDAGADIVYHDLYLVSSLPVKVRFWKHARTRQVRAPVFRDLLFNGNAINNSSVVVKRKLMLKIGGFSEDPLLVAAEDYDAWIRLAKLTDVFVRIDKVLGYYWSGGENISSAERTFHNLVRLKELYIDKLDVTIKERALARHFYGLGRANDAKSDRKVAINYYKQALRIGPMGDFTFKILFFLTLSYLSATFFPFKKLTQPFHNE